MRLETVRHAATTAMQYERFASGIAWDDPAKATAGGANAGATISGVLSWGGSNAIFGGTEYIWGPMSIPWTATPQDPQKFPNGLRFSGFNINDVGATGDCQITNLFVHITYSDVNVLPGELSIIEGIPSASNWLVTPVKSGGAKVHQKRMDGIASTAQRTDTVRIPCMKDQSWATDTFGSGIASGTTTPSQRAVYAVPGWFGTPEYYGFPGRVKQDYYESTSTITPLTIAEVNDSNFYLDLWYSRGGLYAGQDVKIYSVSISVEYVKPASSTTTIFCTGAAYGNQNLALRTVDFGSSKNWEFPARASSADAPGASYGVLLNGNYDANVDVFSGGFPQIINNTGNVNDQLVRFDTDMLIGRLDTLANVDDSIASITDIIVDCRISGRTNSNYAPDNIPRLRWTYFLMDGHKPADAASLSEPIYKYQSQMYEAGIRPTYAQAGQDWNRLTGGYNMTELDYYGSADSWFYKHHAMKRHQPIYSVELTNTSTYPGLAYDPLWIEKALKAGRLYIGLVLSIDPGTAVYYNTNPKPQWYIRIDCLRLRIAYNPVGAAASNIAGLLIRQTP